MGKMAEHVNQICIRILQLVYLNVLWIVFTIAGLILFGFGPATFAMLTVIRQWIRGNTDIPVFSTFWNNYKTNFKETSLIGITYLIVGIILYTDLLYVQSILLRILLIMVSICYLVSFCYIFPIVAHYDWNSMLLKIKSSLLFGISYLQYTLCLFVLLAIVLVVILLNPGLFIFFGGSVGGYIIMWMTHQVFTRIEGYTAIKDSNSNKSSI
ncbi:YesL family protein [Heyndrickxia oleronia]|uniref:DUF624 domain-containing protein n=1 Tax=Heyndrickxia oleronia TaxID=38875 RepID=A0AAW6SYB2_9BACI|nr:DUF624 domain-containing protein [Heyndrickxia oleronia]MDH5162242.1 DUF624 domain-containing protein [Heyndrickxia oleronia]